MWVKILIAEYDKKGYNNLIHYFQTDYFDILCPKKLGDDTYESKN